VTLLDAYAIVAFLADRPAAQRVQDLLTSGGANVTTANLAEALDVTQRVYGVPVGEAMEILGPLLEGVLRPIGLDVVGAQRAAEMRTKHYHRATRPISLADAILISSASAGHTIATADPDVLAIAALEGIPTIELPGEE
jgi:hypothetical protein